MFSLSDLNLMCGIGWDLDYSSLVELIFHEQDGGISEEITIKAGRWAISVNLQTPLRTAHLPSTMAFRRTDLTSLFYKLKPCYKDMKIPLPLEFSPDGFIIKYGPASGIKINARKS